MGQDKLLSGRSIPRAKMAVGDESDDRLGRHSCIDTQAMYAGAAASLRYQLAVPGLGAAYRLPLSALASPHFRHFESALICFCEQRGKSTESRQAAMHLSSAVYCCYYCYSDCAPPSGTSGQEHRPANAHTDSEQKHRPSPHRV